MNSRVFEVVRETRETRITAQLRVEGAGESDVSTGIGFLDHMLASFTFWGRFDLDLQCEGDLEVDDHHTVEDCGLVLGALFDGALDDRRGIARFGTAYAPMDEALARVVVDLSGRPYCVAELDTRRERLGALSLENVPHFFGSFAQGARANVHVDVLRGENDHHKVEAAFKAAAMALGEAIKVTGVRVPSVKGSV